jgi:hypothetical protein
MFFFTIFFGDVCQLLDQCMLSQLLVLQSASIDEVLPARPALRSAGGIYCESQFEHGGGCCPIRCGC